jgi:beta-N-acetylhexosaminidase
MTLGPLMVDIQGTRLSPEDRDLLVHPLVGSLILFTRNFESVEQLEALVRDIQALRSPSLLIAVDHEGGRVQRFRKDFTVLPSMRLIGRQYDQEAAAGRRLARQCGWLMAAELRAIGIDMSFAPCVDLDYGASTVIGDRAFHRDPQVVGDLALSFMNGMRAAGMAATAKHFPGHGAVVADSHVARPIDRRSSSDLLDDEIPYRRLIENGLPAIMAAHVIYPDVDERPASLSSRWLRDHLRSQLGFTGAIFTDDLSMEAAAVAGSMADRVQAALQAGCDMAAVCNNRRGAVQAVERLGSFDDPVGQIRLARLRGVAGPTRQELLASAEWREQRDAVVAAMERPSLQLNA